MAETNAAPIAIEAETGDVEATTTGDTKITTPASTKSSLHTDGVFPRGPSDQSLLIDYIDHVAYRLWYIYEKKKYVPTV